MLKTTTQKITKKLLQLYLSHFAFGLTTVWRKHGLQFYPVAATTGVFPIRLNSLDDLSFFADNKDFVLLGNVCRLKTDGGTGGAVEKDLYNYAEFRGVHYSNTQNLFIAGYYAYICLLELVIFFALG